MSLDNEERERLKGFKMSSEDARKLGDAVVNIDAEAIARRDRLEKADKARKREADLAMPMVRALQEEVAALQRQVHVLMRDGHRVPAGEAPPEHPDGSPFFASNPVDVVEYLLQQAGVPVSDMREGLDKMRRVADERVPTPCVSIDAAFPGIPQKSPPAEEPVANEVDALQTQLGGCLMAAEGWGDRAGKDAYGWSPAYQAVLDLRDRSELLKEERDSAIAQVEQMKFVQRFGTPFDPTGAKTGVEIQSFRRRVTEFDERLAQKDMEIARTDKSHAEIKRHLKKAERSRRGLKTEVKRLREKLDKYEHEPDDDKPYCCNVGPGRYRCTLPVGHKGEHEARAVSDGGLIMKWTLLRSDSVRSISSADPFESLSSSAVLIDLGNYKCERCAYNEPVTAFIDGVPLCDHCTVGVGNEKRGLNFDGSTKRESAFSAKTLARLKVQRMQKEFVLNMLFVAAAECEQFGRGGTADDIRLVAKRLGYDR